MFPGALRSVIRPVSRTILSSRSPFMFPITSSPSPACDRHVCHLSPFLGNVGGIPASTAAFHSASLRVRPAGNVRGRDEKNRMKQHRAIILSERRKKLKAQVEEANRREREKWDEQRIEKYWLNYLSEKKKRKEERKEANRRKEYLEHMCGKDRRKFVMRRREFEEDKKKDPAVAAMSWASWMQWRRIQKEIQSSGGVEAKLKSEKKKRKEERKEANGRKEYLEHMCGKNRRKFVMRRREFEEDKKKDAAVAAMSWASWMQWRRRKKFNPVEAGKGAFEGGTNF